MPTKPLTTPLTPPYTSPTATLRSDTTAISGAMSLAANTPLESHAGWGIVETVSGEALNLLLGSAVQVSGWLQYQLLE